MTSPKHAALRASVWVPQVIFTLAKNTTQAEIGFLKKKAEDKS